MKKPIKAKRKNKKNTNIFLLIAFSLVFLSLVIILSVKYINDKIYIVDNDNSINKEISTEYQKTASEAKELTNDYSKYLIQKESRQTAPDFVLNTLDNKTISLSSLKGKVILLDFTATWCSWCVKQAPHLEDLFINYNKKGFVVLSIDCKEDFYTVKEYYSNKKMLFPVLLDTDGSIFNNYSVRGYPEFFLIDKEGKVAYNQSGYKENMKDLVGDLIQIILDKE